jgi:hypothetical protein
MPVQDVRVIEMPVSGDARGDKGPRPESSGTIAAAPRPAAVDAVRWGATLLMQLGLDPNARNPKRTAA